jgi:hypothetical protein
MQVAIHMACIMVREREDTEVAKELATSLAPVAIVENNEGAGLVHSVLTDIPVSLISIKIKKWYKEACLPGVEEGEECAYSK